jgi:S1-C subfamily serine protease
MSTGRTTQRLDHSFSQSVGAGMRSVFGGKGRTYFLLRHMTNSLSHRYGEEQPIIIDYVELGRDPKCQVRFDNDLNTVSRRHAAILKEGNSWVIKNLSLKNPTLVNGRPVNRQWFLNSGDEIQLSMEGPKIGFVIPSNSSVSSIPLTQRLNLFRRQALLPYKRALFALSIVFLLTISGLSAWLYKLNDQNNQLTQQLVQAVKDGKTVSGNVDSLRSAQANVVRENETLRGDIRRLQGNLNNSRKKMEEKFKKMEEDNAKAKKSLGNSTTSEEIASAFRQFYKDVYFIRATRLYVEYDGDEAEIEYPMTATGFLLNDGRFVTARHVVEPWAFIEDGDEFNTVLNAVVNNGGTVFIDFEAVSGGGPKLTFSSKMFTCDRSKDESYHITDYESDKPVLLTTGRLDDGADWAYWRTSYRGGISIDPGASQNLPGGASLRILGYPFGLGVDNAIEPIQSSVETASSTKQNDMIVVTGAGVEPGNSGGPAFYEVNGQYTVIGIVSVKASSIGLLVPISNIQNR